MTGRYSFRGRAGSPPKAQALTGTMKSSNAGSRIMTNKLNRDEAVGYNNLGVALGTQEKWEDAIAAFWKAIELDPDYVKAYINLGVALGKLGKLEEAGTVFRKVLSIKPNDAEALVHLAVTLEAQGQEAVARMYWQKAKKVEQRPEWVEQIKEALDSRIQGTDGS